MPGNQIELEIDKSPAMAALQAIDAEVARVKANVQSLRDALASAPGNPTLKTALTNQLGQLQQLSSSLTTAQSSAFSGGAAAGATMGMPAGAAMDFAKTLQFPTGMAGNVGVQPVNPALMQGSFGAGGGGGRVPPGWGSITGGFSYGGRAAPGWDHVTNAGFRGDGIADPPFPTLHFPHPTVYGGGGPSPASMAMDRTMRYTPEQSAAAEYGPGSNQRSLMYGQLTLGAAYGAARAWGADSAYNTERYLKGGDSPMDRASNSAHWLSLGAGVIAGIATSFIPGVGPFASLGVGTAVTGITDAVLQPMLKALAAPEENRQESSISLAPFFGSRFGAQGFAQADRYSGAVLGQHHTDPGGLTGPLANTYDLKNSRLARLVHRTDAGLLRPEFRFGNDEFGSGMGNAAPILGAIGGTLFNFGIDPFAPGELVRDPAIPRGMQSPMTAYGGGDTVRMSAGGGGQGGGGGLIQGGGSGFVGGSGLVQEPDRNYRAPAVQRPYVPHWPTGGGMVQGPRSPQSPGNIITTYGGPMGDDGGTMQFPGYSEPSRPGRMQGMADIPGGDFQENRMETYFRRTGKLFGKDNAADAWKRMAPGFDPFLGGNRQDEPGNIADVLGRLGAVDTLAYLRIHHPDLSAGVDEQLLSGVAGQSRANMRSVVMGSLQPTRSGAAQMAAHLAELQNLAQLPDGVGSMAWAQADAGYRSARAEDFTQTSLSAFGNTDVQLKGQRARQGLMPFSPGNIFGTNLAILQNNASQIGRINQQLGLPDLTEQERYGLLSQRENLRTSSAQGIAELAEGFENRLPALAAGRPSFAGRYNTVQGAALNLGALGSPIRAYGAGSGAQARFQELFVSSMGGDNIQGAHMPMSNTHDLNTPILRSIEGLLSRLVNNTQNSGGKWGGRTPRPVDVVGSLCAAANDSFGHGQRAAWDSR